VVGHGGLVLGTMYEQKRCAAWAEAAVNAP
jgi:hypothetical protein